MIRNTQTEGNLSPTLAIDPADIPIPEIRMATETQESARPPVAGTTLFSAEEVRSIERTSAPPTLMLGAQELAATMAARPREPSSGTQTPPKGTMVIPASALPPRPRDSVPPTALPTPPPVPRLAARGVSPAVAIGAVAAAVIVLFGAALAAPQLLVARSRNWIAPMVLGKSDPHVVEIASALEKQAAEKTQLDLRKNEIEARLRKTDAALAMEASFRTTFKGAVRADLAARRAEATRLRAALATYAVAGADETVTKHVAAKLETARQRVRMLQAALDGRAMSRYDTLSLQREYDRSLFESENLVTERAALATALAEVDASLGKNAALTGTLEASPFHVAAGQDVTLGFLPYENAANVKAGAPLVSCEIGTLFCTRVGTVTALVPGDVRGSSPISGKETRGQVVRVTMTDANAGSRPLLFADVVR